MLCTCGKSGAEAGRRDQGRSQPADQQHDGGVRFRKNRRTADLRRGGSCGLWRKPGGCAAGAYQGGGSNCGSGKGNEKPADPVASLSGSADVSVHGTYDGTANTGNFSRFGECGRYGADTAAADAAGDCVQPQIFPDRTENAAPAHAEYGQPDCGWLRRGAGIWCFCAVSDFMGTGARRCGPRAALQHGLIL